MHKKRTKCPICGNYDFPSNDHIPPRSCGNISDVTNRYIFPTINGYKKISISQGGLHFNYICSNCNNRLGSDGDKALASLYNTISNSCDEIITWKGNIRALITSIFGHILAAGPYSPVTYDKEMRDFIVNQKTPIKTHLFLLYYPYKYIFIIKDALPMTHFYRYIPMKRIELDIVSCLYFYPLAFVVGEPKSISLGVDLLDLLKKGQNEIKLSIHSFKNILTGEYMPPCWPCDMSDRYNPDTVDAIASGKEATDAVLSQTKFKKYIH